MQAHAQGEPLRRTDRRLVALMLLGVGIRFVLAIRGGQYFDWDEHRYGFSALMLQRLANADVGGMLDILFRYPEHPGFKIIGLVPAVFHLASASPTGYPITEMRFPSGEWLPAFLFSLASVASIGLTHAIASRSGATRDESLLAAFLMFSSTTMLVHARHFFPYDASMALFLCAIWIGIPAGPPARSFLVGVLSGCAFLTYEGYWLLAGVVAGCHLISPSMPAKRALGRVALFAAGFLIVPALLVEAAALRGRDLLHETLKFSETVTHGDYSEGWSLPWKYLWDVEHGLLLVFVIGIGLGYRDRRARVWAASAAAIYVGLVLGSNVLHRFVVYDRLVRQMVPFICLAAAAGLVSLRPRVLYSAITLLFVLNCWPLFTQRFPRDIVGEIVRVYGSENVELESSLANTIDSTGGIFLPINRDGAPAAPGTKRYLLVNASDIWIEGPPGVKPLRSGAVLRTDRHPRALRAFQYHGYTPQLRAFLRSTDLSIRLVDTQTDRPHVR